MGSGGNLLPGDAMLLDSIYVLSAGIDGRQQLRRVQAPKRLLRDLQDFPDQRRGGLDPLVALPRRRPQPHGGKGRLDHVRGAQMSPVLPGELVERDEARPVLV